MIEIIDIGASPFEEPAPYERMVTLGQAHVTGFEPEPTAFAALKPDKNRSYLQCAIGDGGIYRFYRYEGKGFSSLFPIHARAAQLFPEATDWFKLLGVDDMPTKRLDDLRLPCDYLKMDCQGSELMILQNARETLLGTVLVQIEVGLSLIYVCQPSLGQIDRELRGQGFEARNFLSAHIASTGATIDADMLYVRREPTEEQGRRIELILEHCYPRCRR